VATTQLWYPTQKVTDPSVAIIIFTGVDGYHPDGVFIAGISPTNLWTCRGNASMQVPMLEIYCTRVGGLIIMHCDILHVSIIFTNRGLVCVSTTCIALAGLSHAVGRVVKRRRALLWAECFSHALFELWYMMLWSEARYHSNCWWRCSIHSPSRDRTNSYGANYLSASFHAFQ
jgi:hypothetical protein